MLESLCCVQLDRRFFELIHGLISASGRPYTPRLHNTVVILDGSPPIFYADVHVYLIHTHEQSCAPGGVFTRLLGVES